MDGAAALTGSEKGVQAEVRQVAPHVNIVHCIIHREALASCVLQPQLCTVLLDAVRVMYFLKALLFNSCLFAVCSIVQGNADRPQITSIEFGCKVVIRN
jgi:hypothetical protein